MKFEEVCWYSERVNDNMRIKIYGHYGVPFIVFPSYNKQSDEFANEGVIDALSGYINEGRIKLFCLDAIDYKTVCNKDNYDYGNKSYLIEQYFQYVINEVLPFIYKNMNGFCLPVLTGCSMGAYRASTMFFRRPDLFNGILCLSGGYNLNKFFNDYCDDNLYNNNPTYFLKNMPNDHYYINLYNTKRMIFVCGQGSWEHLVLDSNYELKDILNSKGINAWYDILDYNSIHDWSSWKEQYLKYINFFL